ncbi:MAG TPA: ABC transporter permease subunit [Stellaceae bacterium]|nr:ABC transporter permease subunit [Stellaceae bacterium]
MTAKLRLLIPQLLVLGGVIALGADLVHNTLANLARQGIATGFGYLDRQASFGIGEGLIAYSPADTYGRALLVGLLNTIEVAILGCVLATILGVAVGIARLASNWLVRTLAGAYVEAVRNVPLLLQLFLWWNVFRIVPPPPRGAWRILPGFFLSNRGLTIPLPSLAGGWHWDVPHLAGFNFVGGHTMSPEFAALLVGLVIYTAAFIGEIVRAGIAGVPRGQSEAAMSLGLKPWPILALVILPQARRIIIPPLIGEYLALTKNSSLAVAIGFPDLMSITNTTLNQTGQAIEAIALMMAVYLGLSLTTSLALNLYNARIAARER